MELQSYQRLVLRHALHVIACDGHIDQREVEELRRLTKTTPYFDEVDVDVELAEALNTLRRSGVDAVTSALEHLRDQDLTERQRFRLLDVLLQVVHADDVVQEAESTYLQQAQDALGLTTQQLAQHFPTRFALFVPGAARSYRVGQPFKMPVMLPDSSTFFGD